MKKKFEIHFHDPDTGHAEKVEREFEDTYDHHFISAKDYAEDHAYMLADKGWYYVKEVK